MYVIFNLSLSIVIKLISDKGEMLWPKLVFLKVVFPSDITETDHTTPTKTIMVLLIANQH